MDTLNGYKASGTFSATTTFQTFLWYSTGLQGFITFKTAVGTSMIMGFFEGTTGMTGGSWTQLASSGTAGVITVSCGISDTS
jgi:hypothetical protein